MEKIKGYDITNVWIQKTPELAKEIINFWIKEKALPSVEAAQKRVEQVILIARDNSGNITAVSSVYEKFNIQLENFFYYYRTFVSQSMRKSRLGITMLLEMRDYLETAYINRKKTRAIGIILEIENNALQAYKNEAVWPETKFVFIGKNDKGAHVRLYYFKDAKIS
jgi:hypothetical protein